jgi:amino-acid N-acetyltransferase
MSDHAAFAAKLRPLHPAELEGMRAALAAAGLPTQDLFNTAATFYALEENGKALGYGGFEAHGGAALLRSITILAEKRGLGLGRRLVEEILERAASMGQRDIYLLTTTAPDFFERLGFTRRDRDRVPSPIAATREFAELCPATAICLHRHLVSEGE